VAIGQDDKDVREFRVFNEDLFEMAHWLTEKQIRSIAMESTDTCWHNPYDVLMARGFDVVMCNGKFTKNIEH